MNASELRTDWDLYDGPTGTKPGLLPRESKPGELCGLLSEKIKILSAGERIELIHERKDRGINMLSCLDDILDQNGYGSCASEEAVQACMMIRAFQGLKHIKLSPQSVYPFVNGGRDNGSNIEANWTRIREFGVLPMEVWPRGNGYRKQPPQELFDEFGVKSGEFYDVVGSDYKEQMATAMLLNYVVGYGRRGHALAGFEMIDAYRFWFAQSYGNWNGGGPIIGVGIDDLRRDVYQGYGILALRSVRDDGTSREPKKLSVSEPSYEIAPQYQEAV